MCILLYYALYKFTFYIRTYMTPIANSNINQFTRILVKILKWVLTTLAVKNSIRATQTCDSVTDKQVYMYCTRQDWTLDNELRSMERPLKIVDNNVDEANVGDQLACCRSRNSDIFVSYVRRDLTWRSPNQRRQNYCLTLQWIMNN